MTATPATPDREDEVARIAAVVFDPDRQVIGYPDFGCAGSPDEIAAALYDAGLRSTSRDSEVREWSAWLIEREPGPDTDGQQPEYWAGSTRWGVAVREDWTIDPFAARHFPTKAEAEAVIAAKALMAEAIDHGFTIAEIAEGLAEIGTGGTPAFIRGYNRGYDDAYDEPSRDSEVREAPQNERRIKDLRDKIAILDRSSEATLRDGMGPGLDVERALADGIAYAIARAPVPANTDTARDVAARLAPLVVESGYLAALTASPEPETKPPWTAEGLEPFRPKNGTALMLGVAIGALFQSGRNADHLDSCPVARDVGWITSAEPETKP